MTQRQPLALAKSSRRWRCVAATLRWCRMPRADIATLRAAAWCCLARGGGCHRRRRLHAAEGTAVSRSQRLRCAPRLVATLTSLPQADGSLVKAAAATLAGGVSATDLVPGRYEGTSASLAPRVRSP
jgi:hypothetical protein